MTCADGGRCAISAVTSGPADFCRGAAAAAVAHLAAPVLAGCRRRRPLSAEPRRGRISRLRRWEIELSVTGRPRSAIGPVLHLVRWRQGSCRT